MLSQSISFVFWELLNLELEILIFLKFLISFCLNIGNSIPTFSTVALSESGYVGSPNASVEILFDTDQVVHCRLHGEGVIFLLSICYGRNVVQEREPLWEFLNSIVALSNLPWIALIGSNIVIWNSEKRGGASPCMRAMEAFNNCIDKCGIIELPLAGHDLARSNSSEGNQRIECKLDRSLVNNNFILNGANYEGTILNPGLSNHHQNFISKGLAARLQEPNPS